MRTTRSTVNVKTIKVESSEFYYKPSKNPAKAVVKVNGQVVPLGSMKTHPYTKSKKNGVTPRFKSSQALLDMVNPTFISPKDGECICLDFGSSKAYVFYATATSKSPCLRNIHTKHLQVKDETEEAMMSTPRGELHKDDLAGGWYHPSGLGITPPGPRAMKKCSRHKDVSSQIPFLRKTTLTPQGMAFTRAAGKLLGATAGAVQCHFPELSEMWNKEAEGNGDLIFPPPNMQMPSSLDGKSCVFTNQFIFRCIGPDHCSPFVDKADDSVIALHVDESDEPMVQPLMFLPMGGKQGLGGHLRGTDLIICEHKEGGKVARVVTVAKGTVVVVAFDGASMLHGSDGNKPNAHGDVFSIRLIPYVRGGISKFGRERRAVGSTIKPFLDLNLRLHFKLNHSSLRKGKLVSSYFGKGKNRKLHVGEIIELDDEINANGTRKLKLGWLGCDKVSKFERLTVYSHQCASSPKCPCTKVRKFKAAMIKHQKSHPRFSTTDS